MRNILLIIVAAISLAMGSCQKWEKPSTPESISILTEPLEVGEPSSEGIRAVTIAASADWTAVSNDSWLYVTPSSGHKGIQEVVIHFNANKTGKSRKGSVIFTCGKHSETFRLTQNR